MKLLLLGGLSLASALASAADIEALNAADLQAEVRPGGIGGQAFWNVCSRQFLYAPSFDFASVPGVIEQFSCAVTIDASYAKMIRFYLALYAAEKNPLDLAKARALGDAITRNQQPDGLIPTVFPYDKSRAGRNWLNCMLATIHALRELDGVTSGEE